LQINLDAKKYGTFAEIGAGQEVAALVFPRPARHPAPWPRPFPPTTWPSATPFTERPTLRQPQRLQSMLDHEFDLLLKRLDKTRGDKCTFFAFANTVATKQGLRPGMEEGQGWLGIKFQVHPHGDPSTIIIHARLLDWETPRQQEAVGILGVNLIHGAFYHQTDPVSLIGLLLRRPHQPAAEVDMIKFSGPAFTGVD